MQRYGYAIKKRSEIANHFGIDCLERFKAML